MSRASVLELKLLWADAHRAEEQNRERSPLPNKRVGFTETAVYLFARGLEAHHGVDVGETVLPFPSTEEWKP